MSNFIIFDDGNCKKTYILISYDIETTAENVTVKFASKDFAVTYELHRDTRFENTKDIEEYLEEILLTVVENGIDLKITEYLKRYYVTIGYETGDTYKAGQFSAIKIG